MSIRDAVLDDSNLDNEVAQLSYQITDATLPLNQNYSALRTLGLGYIKVLASTQWTNYNSSDPGITILEQLCYGLTELGYCNDFSINDILTDANGELAFDNQFFAPEKILTTRPVTIDDYRRLLLDEMDIIKDVYIQPDPDAPGAGVYTVALFIEDLEKGNAFGIGQTNNDFANNIRDYLNQNRNLGEVFSTPVVLQKQPIALSADIVLQSGASHDKVESAMRQALAQYVSPTVSRYGYLALTAKGSSSDEIFNGPYMANGWIPNTELSTGKLTQVVLSDVETLLIKIDGIAAINSLTFTDTDETGAVGEGNIAQLTLSSNLQGGQSSQTGQLRFDLDNLQLPYQREKVGAAVDIAPKRPTGTYRDIAEYYSVQNTFPVAWGIGANSPQTDESSYRTAQSRQLKGYLMVFDQLLANQFSQLANIATLFSFKTASTLADAPGKSYNDMPTQLFAPTYYSQPLYDIPDVKPLLLGNNSYHFEFGSSDSATLEQSAWQQFQLDPFNRYMRGMRKHMETTEEIDDRRGRMLDHLMARHGDSGSYYDEIISDARWYGSVTKTRIIVKSLWLQNYQLLSYNRACGYSFRTVKKLGTPGRYRMTLQLINQLSEQGIDQSILKLWRPFIDYGCSDKKRLIAILLNKISPQHSAGELAKLEALLFALDLQDAHWDRHDVYVDGQLKIAQIEQAAKLRPADFDNYSAFEIKTNMLLGLSNYYARLNHILYQLTSNEDFQDWLQNSNGQDNSKPFELSDVQLDVTVTRTDTTDVIRVDEQALMSVVGVKGLAPNLSLYQGHLQQLLWLTNKRQGFILLEHILVAICAPSEFAELLDSRLFAQCCSAFFPSYINLTAKANISGPFSKIQYLHWPAHLHCQLHCLSYTEMKVVISAYVKLYNFLRLGDAPKVAMKKPVNELIGFIQPPPSGQTPKAAAQ